MGEVRGRIWGSKVLGMALSVLECKLEKRKIMTCAHMRTGTNTVLRMGVVPGTDPQRIIQKTNSQCCRKESFSLALALLRDLNNLEIEHELACSAMCCWAQEFFGQGNGRKTGEKRCKDRCEDQQESFVKGKISE